MQENSRKIVEKNSRNVFIAIYLYLIMLFSVEKYMGFIFWANKFEYIPMHMKIIIVISWISLLFIFMK